jgi:uncharacterized repeat protein (TIGR03803 family)
MLQASDGNFYGTTWLGGGDVATCTQYGGCGTVFRFTPAGQFTRIHVFQDMPDGAAPVGDLIQARNGKILGTTWLGGEVGLESGTIFQLKLK